MNKRLGLNIASLPVQIILSFVALIFLTALAIGAPALDILRAQSDRQAWALVDQGRVTTLAVYAELQSELNNLAILTSQRPTLLGLIEQGDLVEMDAYLQTFLAGTDVDLVIVCQGDGRTLAQAGRSELDGICAQAVSSGFYIPPAAAPVMASLVAVQPVGAPADSDMKVVVGEILDVDAMLAIRRQTGLEQTLLAGGQFVATSLLGDQQAWEAWRRSEWVSDLSEAGATQITASLAGEPYYAVRFSLTASLESMVSLPVGEIAAAQRRLTYGFGGGFLFVVLLGSLLAVFLARRISQPLVQLERAAAALQKGDLVTPVAVESKVSEVAQVAYALEDARATLHFTLEALRQEKDWTAHLLASVVEGILTLDQKGRVTFFSQGAERISGCRREQILGHPCDDLFRPVEAGVPFSQLLPLPGKQQKVLVAFPSGRQAVLAVTGAVLAPPEAGKARVVLVLRDVSEEEAVHRLLGEYIGNITHEFRTPLAALAASVELLLDQLPDLTPGELESLLNSVRLGVLSLQTLIDNLLEGASIETGRFQVYLRPADLQAILAEVMRLIRPLADKYRLSLESELPENLPPVTADPRRTAQVLVNLLANAIKHSPKGAEVQVRVTTGPDGVRVAVADRGPGIAPELKAGLFGRVGRPGKDSAEPGAGLGLPVVRAIVEAQGGQVGVEDHPEGGSVFWFTLVLAPEQRVMEAVDP